ncbi:MAG: RIP metalloprotease RseP [Acidobacteria bacterium]|nr:MAG: RIP metalloprotease RseP [Acidobacteriota bacterium]
MTGTIVANLLVILQSADASKRDWNPIASVLWNILGAVLVLSVIIVIHELGHFLVAKFFKIKVETFSVGFGPRLIGFRRGETDYRISAFLLGGYVKMAGETPSDTITGAEHEFLSKPKWQRFLVASAGPAMNVVLAVGILTGLYVYGTEVPEFLMGQAVVGAVEPGSPADRAGIKPGDEIASLDGKERPDWQDVFNVVLTSPGANLPVVVQRHGQRVETTLVPERKGPDESGYVGMGPLVRTVVRRVYGAPALAAGIQVGDEILKVNGIELKNSGRYVQETIQKVPEKTFPITVLRNGREIELQVTPEMKNGTRMIGIEIPFPTVMIKLGLVDGLKRSIQVNTDNAALLFQLIPKLFRREASIKQLNGPIGIIQISGQAMDAGMATLITLMAIISLNLGVLNLLPIPILDGGAMLLLLVESLMGRDLSLRMKERIVQVSFVFLLMLFVIVMYNDVVKLLPPNQAAP